MSAVATTLPNTGYRVDPTMCALAAAVATFGWSASGMLAAVPAGAGFVIVAASDAITRRFLTRALGEPAATGAWGRLGLTATGVMAAAALTVVRLGTGGLAFGDVLPGVFTTCPRIPVGAGCRCRSGRCATDGRYGRHVRAARLGANRPTTVPLAPALLVGWLVGVAVA